MPSTPAGPRSLAVVIPNWNSGPLLRRCLEAIADARPQSISRIVVVDNASSDGSADVGDLARRLPLRIVTNASNTGFARAANQGSALCGDNDLLFLNPDIAVRSGTIDAAIRVLAESRETGTHIAIVGVRLTDGRGQTQASTSPFPTPWRIFAQACGIHFIFERLARFDPLREQEATRLVDQIMGAFLLIRREAFDALGGFDERFFLYFEDVDLCLRARGEGYRCFYFAGVSAQHTGQGCTRSIEDVRLFYLLRSRLQFADKHFGKVGRIATRIATFAVEPAGRAAHHLFGGAIHKLPMLRRSYAMLIRDRMS